MFCVGAAALHHPAQPAAADHYLHAGGNQPDADPCAVDGDHGGGSDGGGGGGGGGGSNDQW